MKTKSPSTGKIRRIAVIAAAVIVMGLLSWWLLRDGTDDSALQLYGNVDIREVELAFRQPGRLASMAFDEGDAVVAGKIMAELDAQPYVEKLAAAQAGFDAAKAGLDKLRKKDPTFPKPIKSGTSRQAAAYYVISELNAWLACKIKDRDAE